MGRGFRSSVFKFGTSKFLSWSHLVQSEHDGVRHLTENQVTVRIYAGLQSQRHSDRTEYKLSPRPKERLKFDFIDYSTFGKYNGNS